jgi:hypothetical protein
MINRISRLKVGNFPGSEFRKMNLLYMENRYNEAMDKYKTALQLAGKLNMTLEGRLRQPAAKLGHGVCSPAGGGRRTHRTYTRAQFCPVIHSSFLFFFRTIYFVILSEVHLKYHCA